ncbi:MAG: hypothetical protein GX495_16415 [Chloroflexi bacterium]|jgi:hypothetical protein|nr:hypothetical protein [Chloroflexota bacterium]
MPAGNLPGIQAPGAACGRKFRRQAPFDCAFSLALAGSAQDAWWRAVDLRLPLWMPVKHIEIKNLPFRPLLAARRAH